MSKVVAAVKRTIGNLLSAQTRGLMGIMSSPEQEYFDELVNNVINRAQRTILLLGYDEPFMSYAPTRAAFSHAVERGVAIEAIFPEGIETILDEHEILPHVDIRRYPAEQPGNDAGYDFTEGRIVVDGIHAVAWDSNKDTTYSPEMGQGKYWRVSSNTRTDRRLAQEFITNIRRLEPELEQRLSTG